MNTRIESEIAMYVFHYDKPNDQWNVYYRHDGREEYVTSFKDLQDAMNFCEEKNEVME